MLGIVTDKMPQDAVKYTDDEIQVKHCVGTNSHTQKCGSQDTSLVELKAFVDLL